MFKKGELIMGIIWVLALIFSPTIGSTKYEAKEEESLVLLEEEEFGYRSGEGELLGDGFQKCNKQVSENAEYKDKMYVAADRSSLTRGGEPPKVESPIMPIEGAISSGFGPRWGRQHKGIDLDGNTGDEVRAFMSGVVTFSGWNSGGYGYLVIIDHNNGLESYYAHNSKVLVEEGQYVNQESIISNVGSTGRSTGPHLHFEIRKDGTPVNPMDFFK